MLLTTIVYSENQDYY